MNIIFDGVFGKPFGAVMDFINKCISEMPDYIIYSLYFCIALVFIVSLISIIRSVLQ